MAVMRKPKNSDAATAVPAPPVTDKKSTGGETTSSMRVGIFFSVLLAAQYGLQPFLTSYIPASVRRVSVVLAIELTKIIISVGCMLADGTLRRTISTWTIRAGSLSVAPAVIYAGQNVLLQIGYQHLDSVTFNCINQTKLVSTALCVYLLFGQRQSKLQMGALAGLMVAGLLLQAGAPSGGGDTKPGGGSSARSRNGKTAATAAEISLGIAAVLVASAMSGLASAVCQLALTAHKKSPHLLTLEMSFASIPLLFLANADDPRTMLAGWKLSALVPVAAAASGGIFVGQVTKHLGGVAKGFAIVGGLVLTGLAQSLSSDGGALDPNQIAALVLVVCSTYLHCTSPPKKEKKA